MTRPRRTLVLAVALAAAGMSRALTQDKPADKPRDKPQEKPAVSSPAQASAPTTTFPAQIDMVTVDAVVTDKKGVAASALKKEDFIITEDGVPQTIASFDAIQVPPLATAEPKARPKVSSNVSKEERSGRSFVVVFDDINLTPMMSQRAKGAVAEFLKSGVREGDHVLLVATGGAAWWSTRMESGRDQLLSLLKRLDGRYIPDTSTERMSDYEAMRINVFHDPQVMERVRRRFETYGVTQGNTSATGGNNSDLSTMEDPMVTGRATEVYYQATSRNRITLEILERVLQALGETRGRKSVILVSQGFIYDPNLDEFKRVVQASRRSNAAIYFLDTRGLEGMPLAMTAQFGPALDERDVGFAFSENIEASEGADSIASDSGGFSVRNTNDLNKGIQRIADESRMYYMIGYNPSNTARDGKFRKIQVKLAQTPGQERKGYSVRARKGYYAPSDGKTAFTPKPGAPDPAFQAAVDSPFDRDDIPLRMTSFVFEETLLGKTQALIATDVDVRNLTFVDKDKRFYDTLEFLLVVAHRESGEFFRYDQKVDLKLQSTTRDKLQKTWFPVIRDFELKPGGYQAKMVVREKSTGRIGTLVHEFEVPDPSTFRISSPVISDSLQPPKEGETQPVKRPLMLARRTFEQGTMLFCSLDVYGAQKDAKTGMPQVAMGYVVKRVPDGATAVRLDPNPIRPTSLGKLSRIVGFQLEKEEPGEYELILQVRDAISGRAIEQHEPFTIVAKEDKAAPENPTPPAAAAPPAAPAPVPTP
jgi:VWFA-related protein